MLPLGSSKPIPPTNFVQEGNALNYTAGADIDSGDFVLIGAIGGVATTDITTGV